MGKQDFEPYIQQLNQTGRVSVKFHSFDRKNRDLIFHLAIHCLSRYRLNFLAILLTHLLKEIILNAHKANVKRLWFNSKKLEISAADGDPQLLEQFKEEALTDLSAFDDQLVKEDLHIQTVIGLKDDMFEIAVMNNSPMSPEEQRKVRERIQYAKTADSLIAGFGNFSGDAEGAGLGLFMNVMMLKQAGLPAENFSVSSDDKRTIARIRIPSEIETPMNLKTTFARVFDELINIPTFPESISKVISMCDDETSDIKDIANEIEKDPSLTAGVLKMANSPALRREQEAKSILMAATTLGIKLIREITLAYSSRRIIDEHYKVFADFWEHSQHCAAYGKLIAEKCGHSGISDLTYLGGLLHDLGKIVLFSVDSELMKELQTITIDRGRISSANLEEMSLGVSHATLGGRLAEKWNLSREIVEMIQNHHSPMLASDKFKVHASVIHIADGLLQIEKGVGSYIHFESEALQALGIRNEDELKKLHEFVKKG